MKKTLIVSYLPRIPGSYTAALLETFREQLPENTPVEHRDLVSAPAPAFEPTSINAYLKQRYMDTPLSEEEQAALAPFAELARQFHDAEIVVLAFPMHNFSIPGPMKTWFDAVMLKEQTWTLSDGTYQGLCPHLDALTLSASGGLYLSPPDPRDHLTTLTNLELTFMGCRDIRHVLAEGMAQPDTDREKSLNRCQRQITDTVNHWYKAAD